MLSLKFGERRQSPRHPLSRLAKFRPADGGTPDYCLAIDLSGGGVRISGFGMSIPDEFVLTICGEGPSEGKYKVVWRNGSEIGAKLIEPAPFSA